MALMRTWIGILLSVMIVSACDIASGEDSDALDITIHDGDFFRIQEFTTPEGVSVWLVEEPSIPIVSLRMAWEVGAMSDPEGQEGLGEMVAYMMNEGAGELDSRAFFERMEELNLSFGCQAGAGVTYCSASMLSRTLDEGFDLIGTAFADPRFDDGPVERFLREQSVWLESSRTDPDYLSAVARETALYPDHPVVREVSEDSLSVLTGAMGRSYKDKMLSRDGVMVTVVGDVDAETLARQIDEVLSGLVEVGPDVDIAPVEFGTPVASPIIVELPLAQSLITFTAPSVAREHPDFLTLQVMNYVFGGGGYNARLNQKLRVEEGLTYGVYSGVYGGQYLRMISGSGQTKNASAGVFIDGIKQQLQAMVDRGVTETELSDVKAYLTGSYALSFDTNAKIAERMMDIRLDGRPPEYFETRNQRIDAVTLEEVNRVATEYMSPERFTFVVVGQPEGLGGPD